MQHGAVLHSTLHHSAPFGKRGLPLLLGPNTSSAAAYCACAHMYSCPCPGDFQLARSEDELVSWLPGLHISQCRKLWLALQALTPHQVSPYGPLKPIEKSPRFTVRLCCVVLCCVVLCCVVLCCVVLCCVVLCCVVLCCVVLCCVVLCFVVSCCIVYCSLCGVSCCIVVVCCSVFLCCICIPTIT